MLLNLSNHPSPLWPDNQISLAIELYNSVEDLSFPQIDPNWNTDDLDIIVDEYVEKVRKIDPEFVHIMGELTFTFRMVQKLEAIGIPCIASTTERKAVLENNKKTSEFKFVRFRPY